MVCSSASSERSGPGPHSITAALVGLSLSLLAPSWALGQVHVVTTTPNLADIVEQIGGDRVSVQSIMRGPEDVHNVSPRPSQMLKLKNAQLFVHSGLDGELWAPLLVKGARNPKLLYGQPGNVDVSKGILLKQVPTGGGLTRALGDIHAFGNTHYALDPLNGVIIARTITDALQYADLANASVYESRYETYAHRLRDLATELTEKIKPYAGTPVATYHRAWPYFLDRFGLVSVAEVEPKPGIAPGPQHLNECIQQMKSRDARVVIVETYNDKANAEFVASKVHGRAVVLALEGHGLPEIDTYEDLFRVNVNRLLKAFQDIGIARPVQAEHPQGSGE